MIFSARRCTGTMVLAAPLALASLAQAATVNLSFDQIAATSSAPVVAGTAPWLNLKIEDTATAGTVLMTVTTALIGSQTLTGIWLNLPGVAGGISSFVLDPGIKGSGQDPFSFVAIDADPGTGSSGIHKLQDLVPTGSTKDKVGAYNVQLRFPNSGGASAFQMNQTESFSLVANPASGLQATSFLALAAQTGGGKPSPSFYAIASLTNAGGAGGSGIAYVAAAVPEPHQWSLTLAGLALLGWSLKRGSRRG